ncbi:MULTISPECIES: hypothetical protein [unclassified Neisseria]|uniref:hypothetical protein n=1 Tax=unclassified Neisseria TaxID=2623750 RepID=UPI002667182A|nr:MULTISPECIES: hypothetical protein [unclassified Neisseria]MDO1510104.1 hypothetical protein [Neisseria sp. MVDL19-042950]MDO1516680.1 hypothetical protein [Neisseria sp. MVDL18-041461]MDO1563827.1 hypothetical protein [Neisseria sp. MVDL20-010259]
MKNDSEMVTFNIYAKVRTNVNTKDLFYDIKVHDNKGSAILNLRGQSLKSDGMIGIHKTKAIPRGAANKFLKEVMLYKKVGGSLIPVLKNSHIIPFHLTEFESEKINPKLLEATIDYFESKGKMDKEKVSQVQITRKRYRYIQVREDFKMKTGVSSSFQAVENVGIRGGFHIIGNIEITNNKLLVFAQGHSNAGHPLAGDGKLEFLVNATVYINKKRLHSQQLEWNPHGYWKSSDSIYTIIGEAIFDLPEPQRGQETLLKLEAMYQVVRDAGSGSFVSNKITKTLSFHTELK